MNPLPDLTRLESVEADLDFRLLELWHEATAVQDWNPETVLAFLRAAYGRGYCDALNEDNEGNRSALLTTHGYKAL